jgi:ankyrin repeat protein
VLGGHGAIVNLLLKNKDNPANIDVIGEDEQTPLQLAILLKNPVIIQSLTKTDPEKCFTQLRDFSSFAMPTELGCAIELNDYEKVESLLKNGADANEVGENGMPVLCFALSKGHADIALLLLNHGANTCPASSSHDPPLYHAVTRGFKSVVEDLLKKDADPNVKSKDGETTLRLAVWNDDEEIVRLLLKHKADPNSAGMCQITPLYSAILKESEPMAELLLQHKADPYGKSCWGKTPFDVANDKKNQMYLDLFNKYSSKKEKNAGNRHSTMKIIMIPLTLITAGAVVSTLSYWLWSLWRKKKEEAALKQRIEMFLYAEDYEN